MQEALKNPHYKKIWEYINWQVRHPEASSLEEALSLEMSPFNGCMVLIDLTQFGYTMTVNEPLKVVSYNKFEYFAIEPVYSKLISVWDSCRKKINNNAQILGRPITLEDILNLFGKTFNETLNGYKFVQLTCEGAFITMKPIEHELHRVEVILGKPLHEQTPETWEKIANLID